MAADKKDYQSVLGALVDYGTLASIINKLNRVLIASAPQEFGRSFLDETADAFLRVFRGLQPALLLLQLSRRYVRPFEYRFPRVGEGR